MTIPVVDMIDATGAEAARIPAGTKRVAIYLTGGGGIAWTPGDVTTLEHDDPQLQAIFRIDQSDTLALDSLNVYLVKDIESGASTVRVAVEQAAARKARGLRTGFYFSRSDWNQIVTAVNAAGLGSWVDFWVAWWTNNRDEGIALLESDARIKAVQWRSGPYYDFNVTRADWPTAPTAPKPAGASGNFTAEVQINFATGHWRIAGLPGHVQLGGPNRWASAKITVEADTGTWHPVEPMPYNAEPLGGPGPIAKLLRRL